MVASHINGDLSLQMSLEGTQNVDLIVIGEEMIKNTPSPKNYHKHHMSITHNSVGESSPILM